MTIDEFSTECLFYNINIVMGCEILLWGARRYFYKVRHLLKDNGDYFTCQEFELTFPNLTTNFLQFAGVIN